MAVKPIPDGYHAITPYLFIKGAAKALEFYQKAFAAEVTQRMDGPGGMILHADLRIGGSAVMLADEFPDMGVLSPETIGGTATCILLYVEDVDSAFRRAIDAGAKELRPVQDQFYGDRSGTVQDPFGHMWTIATHIEDVPPEEMQRRAQAMMESGGK